MTEKVSLAFNNRNPDVLTSIANLSNDEVFTPPELANQMLDILEASWAKSNNGKSIWAEPTTTFLDPFSKSGVFLREITKRLSKGLEEEIPDLQNRINHITKKQVFGISVTELTALLTRRSVYCSKTANGRHSISTEFDNESGNIWFERTEHTWSAGRCKFCGASEREFGRDKDLESHAYALIHTAKPQELISEIFGENMKFDVVIGNPPYQLGDGGGEGSSAVALYHLFVEQAIKLEPRFLTMVIPARWYSGGKGLDHFRSTMLNSKHISQIHDYPETDMCFPNVNIRGGVCYFLWEKDFQGDPIVWNYSKLLAPVSATRPLLLDNVSTFIRYNRAVGLVEKVRKFSEKSMDQVVRSRNPFGIPSNFEDFAPLPIGDKTITLYRSRRGSTKDKEVFVSPSVIKNGLDMVEKKKVLVSKASPGGDEYPHAVIGRPFLANENSVCTETYLIVSLVGDQSEGENLITYMSTRFFRFLVSLVKNTQNISRGCFALVPVQDFSKPWTDDELFSKYGFDDEDIKFIDSLVRPMDIEHE
jgi:site-specific DNA-methyltransferase (adenine-specific)